MKNVLLTDEGDEISLQLTWRPLYQTGGNSIALWRPLKAPDARGVWGK